MAGARYPPTYEELREHTADSDALLSLLTDRVDADLIAASPKLRVIANYAVGYDNIDVDAATRPRHPGRQHARTR